MSVAALRPTERMLRNVPWVESALSTMTERLQRQRWRQRSSTVAYGGITFQGRDSPSTCGPSLALAGPPGFRALDRWVSTTAGVDGFSRLQLASTNHSPALEADQSASATLDAGTRLTIDQWTRESSSRTGPRGSVRCVAVHWSAEISPQVEAWPKDMFPLRPPLQLVQKDDGPGRGREGILSPARLGQDEQELVRGLDRRL